MAAIWSAATIAARADEPSADKPSAGKRVLLIGQGPDGHPPATHEYMAGLRLLDALLSRIPELKTELVQADGEWPEGPSKLRQCDGAVLFVSQGAAWLQSDPRRIEAFAELAARKGGLSVLHWGMGTRDAQPIEGFVRLFGACHGGPDRKYKVLTTRLHNAAPDHPASNHLGEFEAMDEFYYALKRCDVDPAPRPLVEAQIDGRREMVAWTWERSDGGRSFGFSGLHFHHNWRQEPYRRLVLQGVAWSVRLKSPEGGYDLSLPDTAFDLPARNQDEAAPAK